MTLSFTDSKPRIFNVTATLKYGFADKAARPAICIACRGDEPDTPTTAQLGGLGKPLLLRHGQPRHGLRWQGEDEYF